MDGNTSARPSACEAA